jgi:hypothetical protein
MCGWRKRKSWLFGLKRRSVGSCFIQLRQEELLMALTQGGFQAYDFNRMVVLFTMMNDKIEVPCAISTDAMDRLEGSTRITPEQREQQFLRLRDRIEERASRKFLDVELEGNPPGVILRSIDFRPPLA